MRTSQRLASEDKLLARLAFVGGGGWEGVAWGGDGGGPPESDSH